MAAALRALGVVEGDRVVGYIPNCPEAIEAMAATAALGAVWSSTSPDFGVSGVLDRFSQIRPKVVFSVEAVSYNMKTHCHLQKLSQVVNQLDSVEKVVVIPFVAEEENIDLSSIKNSTFLSAFLELGQESDGSYPALEYRQVPFSHPLFIMYSSGTTGAPKCMVHSVGGTLIKHLEEHIVQGNRDDTDTLLYYTTTGWMMWNWEVSLAEMISDIYKGQIIAGHRPRHRLLPGPLRRVSAPPAHRGPLGPGGPLQHLRLRDERQVDRRAGGPRGEASPLSLSGQSEGHLQHGISADAQELRLRLQRHQGQPPAGLNIRRDRHHLLLHGRELRPAGLPGGDPERPPGVRRPGLGRGGQ